MGNRVGNRYAVKGTARRKGSDAYIGNSICPVYIFKLLTVAESGIVYFESFFAVKDSDTFKTYTIPKRITINVCNAVGNNYVFKGFAAFKGKLANSRNAVWYGNVFETVAIFKSMTINGFKSVW